MNIPTSGQKLSARPGFGKHLPESDRKVLTAWAQNVTLLGKDETFADITHVSGRRGLSRKIVYGDIARQAQAWAENGSDEPFRADVLHRVIDPCSPTRMWPFELSQHKPALKKIRKLLPALDERYVVGEHAYKVYNFPYVHERITITPKPDAGSNTKSAPHLRESTIRPLGPWVRLVETLNSRFQAWRHG